MKKIIILFIFSFLIIPLFANNAFVISSTTSITIKGDKKIEDYTVRIQVNNQSGDQYTSFQLPFSKNRKLKKLAGRITDLSGNNLHKLTNKEIKTSSRFSNSTFYSDNFIKTFSLKHNVYPYIVECSYSYETSSFLYISHWSPVEDTDIPTQTAELYFNYPKGYQFRIKSNLIDEAVLMNPSETIDRETLIWKSKYSVLDDQNIMSPPINELIPNLQIVPLKFKYIVDGSFDTWEKFGIYLTEISANLHELPSTEILKIDNLTKGLSNEKDVINILYHYLQDNTRYINVNIDFGGLQPYPASYVCMNKYGDCKALSNYMQALLEYKNIKAHTAIVDAGSIYNRIDLDFPAQQFNHVILCIPLATDSIWLECTSNISPCNYLGTFTQNRNVLLIDGVNSKIIKTPQLSNWQSKSIHTYIFKESTINSIEAEVSFLLKGEAYEDLNSVITYHNEKGIEDYIINYLDLHNHKIINWDVNKENRDTSTINLKANITCQNPYRKIGDFIKVDHPAIKIPRFEKTKDRSYDVRINSPICSIDTIIYNSDLNDYQLKDAPSYSNTNEFGQFTIKRIIDGDCLMIIREIQLPIQDILLSEYSHFYDFYSSIIKTANSTLLVKKTILNE